VDGDVRERRLGILMRAALRENGMDTAGTCGEMEGMYVNDTPSGNDDDEGGNGGREDAPYARGSMADAVETERPMVTVAEMGSGEPMMGASGCKTSGMPRVSEHGHGRMGERDAAGAGEGFNVEHFEDMGTCEGTPMVIWALIWQQALVLQERVLYFVGICDGGGCDKGRQCCSESAPAGRVTRRLRHHLSWTARRGARRMEVAFGTPARYRALFDHAFVGVSGCERGWSGGRVSAWSVGGEHWVGVPNGVQQLQTDN
jgi:hypothetical protein